MLKTLFLCGMFLFIFSMGFVIKDWDNSDGVVLLNEDNIITPCPDFDGRAFLLSGGTLTLEQQEIKKQIVELQDKRLQQVISEAEKNGGGLAQDVNGGLE